VGHALVLGLGFVLVIPTMSSHATAQPVVANHSYTVLPASFGGNAADSRDLLAEDQIERPSPRAVPTPAPTSAPTIPAAPAQAPAKPAQGSGTFKPPPGSGGDGLAAIYAVFGNSPGLSWALRVANCESHYNPLAINRYSGASGLFQFMPSTWNANFPGWNIWDPYAQARAALRFYNAGRQSAWTCK
jgi:hypothetical protein